MFGAGKEVDEVGQLTCGRPATSCGLLIHSNALKA